VVGVAREDEVVTEPAVPEVGRVPVGYGELLELVKGEVQAARVQAARVVNTELVVLYWRIGTLIRQRRAEQGWGTKVVERLAADLRSEFPGMRGFSPRNLVYMQTFAGAVEGPVAQQAVAQLPWGHVTVLLDKLDDPGERDFYASRAASYGWSRAVLTHHITTGLHRRSGEAVTNFSATLGPESDLVTEIVQDPYNLDFLALEPGFTERHLEDTLVARLTHFLAELGEGFAFVGRQYRLTVDGEDFFADLLFFHLGLRRYIVFELKVGAAAPAHLGQLSFYVNVVDDLMRRPEHDDGPTIGILLAATRNDVVVEYALRGFDTPLAVSTYRTTAALPDEVRAALPSVEDLTDVVRHARDEPPASS
jgi:predicted nuclease of restriction endonuclease-like (RecB) superfamily